MSLKTRVPGPPSSSREVKEAVVRPTIWPPTYGHHIQVDSTLYKMIPVSHLPSDQSTDFSTFHMKKLSLREVKSHVRGYTEVMGHV